jgi:hypothetical protein
MPAGQADDKVITDKKGRLNRYVLIISGISFLILMIVIIAQTWLVPSFVRKEFEKGLAKFCEGPVEIDSAKVNHSGRVFLEGIRFYGKSQRQWMFAEEAKATFADWPRIRPIVREIEFDKLNVQILYADGKLTLPLVRPSRQLSGPNKRVDIHKLAIKDAVITIADAQGSKLVYDNLTLSALRKDGNYEFSLKWLGSDKSEVLLANGRVNLQDLDFDVSLQMKHQFTKAEMVLLFSALNKPQVSTYGYVSADLTIAGTLKEPKALKAEGKINLDDWIAETKNNLIAQNVTTQIKLNNQRLDFENFTANFCKGWVNGSFYAELGLSQPTEFGGQILAMNVDLVQLTSVLATKKKATKGAITLNYKFTADSNDLKNLQGEGLVFFDDADISVLPVIPTIFGAVGLSSYDPLTMSDAQATFTMAGPIVTITNAHIANRFAAIEAEPGGTANLQTEHIDMRVVAIPLKQLDSLLRRVPIVNIFTNLKDKLTRLHIKGQWSDPPNRLITKEPIKDIKDGTVGFLQDVVKSGGQLSETMFEGLGILFKNKQNNKK